LSTGEEDASAFVIELQSFLKEYGCPHRSLLASDALAHEESRVVLLGATTGLALRAVCMSRRRMRVIVCV
jgi:hypothetical protein